MIPEMTLAYLSWEAFATFMTGFAAVAAAFIIGSRQTRILAKQAKIESTKTHVELFERRMRIVELHSKLLSLNYDKTTRLPYVQEFMDVRGTVRFLFSEEIEELFDNGYKISVHLDIRDPDDYVTTRSDAQKNRAEFLGAVEPYMRLGTESIKYQPIERV